MTIHPTRRQKWRRRQHHIFVRGRHPVSNHHIRICTRHHLSLSRRFRLRPDRRRFTRRRRQAPPLLVLSEEEEEEEEAEEAHRSPMKEEEEEEEGCRWLIQDL